MADHFGETIERHPGEAEATEMSDQQLLERFASRHEESSFTTLVQRHGALVRGVCRRVLNNEHDAEDAFQATFLVLARKAPHVRWKPSVGPWLYQVANRTSQKIKTGLIRQRERNTTAAKARPVEVLDDMTWRELRQVMDEEMDRLPEKYRAVVVLCCLEGKSRDEAADALGWSLNSVKSCLEAGRELLRSRLAKRGLTLSATMFAMLLSQQAMAAVPPALVGTTVQAAMAFTAKSASAGAVAESVRLLAESQLHAMSIVKAKMVAAVAACALAFASTAAVGGVATYQYVAERSTERSLASTATVLGSGKSAAVQGAVIRINRAANRMTVSRPGAVGSATQTTYDLHPQVKVFVDNNRERQLQDIPPHFTGSLTLTMEDQKVVEMMVVGVTVRDTLASVSPSEQTINLTGQEPSQSVTPILARGAVIKRAGKDGVPLSLAELQAGQNVTVLMSADGTRAVEIVVNSD
jgi:RNA polymerase sigma factor (sigma-70 family)